MSKQALDEARKAIERGRWASEVRFADDALADTLGSSASSSSSADPVTADFYRGHGRKRAASSEVADLEAEATRTHSRAELQKMRVRELKALLKERGLAVSGTKQVLVNRLLNDEEDGGEM